MIQNIGTMKLTPDALAQVRQEIVDYIAYARSEDGCLGYIYAEDLCEPGLILINEKWRDAQALQAHGASEKFASLQQALAPHKPEIVIRSYITDEGQPLSL